jgi:hypothetical protein
MSRFQTAGRGPTIGRGERLALRGPNGQELRAVHPDEREQSPSVVDDGDALRDAKGRGALHRGPKDVERPFMREHQMRSGVCDRYPSLGRCQPEIPVRVWERERGSRRLQRPASTVARKSATSRLNDSGSSRFKVCLAAPHGRHHGERTVESMARLLPGRGSRCAAPLPPPGSMLTVSRPGGSGRFVSIPAQRVIRS